MGSKKEMLRDEEKAERKECVQMQGGRGQKKGLQEKLMKCN